MTDSINCILQRKRNWYYLNDWFDYRSVTSKGIQVFSHDSRETYLKDFGWRREGLQHTSRAHEDGRLLGHWLGSGLQNNEDGSDGFDEGNENNTRKYDQMSIQGKIIEKETYKILQRRRRPEILSFSLKVSRNISRTQRQNEEKTTTDTHFVG